MNDPISGLPPRTRDNLYNYNPNVKQGGKSPTILNPSTGKQSQDQNLGLGQTTEGREKARGDYEKTCGEGAGQRGPTYVLNEPKGGLPVGKPQGNGAATVENPKDTWPITRSFTEKEKGELSRLFLPSSDGRCENETELFDRLNQIKEKISTDKKLPAKIDCGRLFAGGELNMTIAFGYDDKSLKSGAPIYRQTIEKLKDENFEPKENGCFEKTFQYGNQTITARVKLVHPISAFVNESESCKKAIKDFYTASNDKQKESYVKAKKALEAALERAMKDFDAVSNEEKKNSYVQAKEAFKAALENDKVVIYCGHSNNGVGPRFCPKEEENKSCWTQDAMFYMGCARPNAEKRLRERFPKERLDDLKETTLREGCQVLFFNSCRSYDFGGALLEKKNIKDLSYFGTTGIIHNYGGLEDVNLEFISGLMQQKSAEDILNGIVQRANHRKDVSGKRVPAEKTSTYFDM
jgi:hypothetical protein